MKKVYMKPQIYAENFLPNEYIAACYRIYCETPRNNSTYYRIYDDTNKNGIKDRSDKLLLNKSVFGFYGCGQYHKGIVQDNPPTANGFVTDALGGNAQSVFWWKERLGSTYDYHVMTPGGKGYEDITTPEHPNASA